MAPTNETVCVCPVCHKVYRQSHVGEWSGKRVSTYREPLWVRAQCQEAGQIGENYPWYGSAMCADCSLARTVPALRPALEKWLREGETE